MQKDIILVCQTLLENRKNLNFITLADSKGIAYFSNLLYATLCWEWAEGGGVGKEFFLREFHILNLLNIVLPMTFLTQRMPSMITNYLSMSSNILVHSTPNILYINCTASFILYHRHSYISHGFQ